MTDDKQVSNRPRWMNLLKGTYKSFLTKRFGNYWFCFGWNKSPRYDIVWLGFWSLWIFYYEEDQHKGGYLNADGGMYRLHWNYDPLKD